MSHSQTGSFILPFPYSHSDTSIPHTQALTGECGFLAANLYARSVFGEDALANLSIEKPVGGAEGGAPTTGVQGHIRIRAKTQVSDPMMSSGHVTFYDVMVVSCDPLQGMALSLGDKINHSQRATRS